MQQKLWELHKTFFTRKLARKFTGPILGPVSLLFLLKLTRSFLRSEKLFFLYVIPFQCALVTCDVPFKAVVKKKEQQTFPVDIEVK